MKFQPRRFVVEVKRGTSRTAFASPDTVSDKFSSAEEMLFGSATKPAAIEVNSLQASPGRPARRILESLIEPPPAVIEDLPERPRRGRKPGSKNKPKFLPEARATEIPVSIAGGTPVPKRIDRSAIAERRGFAEDGPSWRDQVIQTSPLPASTRTVDTSAGSDLAGSDLETPPDVRQVRVRLRDRSNILKRYVLGTQPMPGQPGALRARRAARAADNTLKRVSQTR